MRSDLESAIAKKLSDRQELRGFGFDGCDRACWVFENAIASQRVTSLVASPKSLSGD